MTKRIIPLQFHVSSRLPLLLGAELIPDAGYAVFELVKNAHDADATAVTVELNAVDNKHHGRILILDNGNGMDSAILQSGWLTIGTTSSYRHATSGLMTPLYKRPYLGAKGVGRFSVHKLGTQMQLTTRPRPTDKMPSPPEYVLDIDWTKFATRTEQPDKFLHEIEVSIVERSPQIFTDSESHGTCIEISKLYDDWSRKDVRDLHRALVSISSPFDAPSDFKISMNMVPDNGWLNNLIAADDVLEYAVFTATASISDSHYEYDYEMNRIASHATTVDGRKLHKQGSLRCISEKEREDLNTGKMNEDKLRFILTDEESDALKEIGAVSLKLYIYDLATDIVELLISRSDRTGFRRYLRENGGIRVYRGGIRIFGLGGAGEDWLNLGGRRVQDPSIRLSNNQIIGALSLEPRTSAMLLEQTNRRGFVENAAYSALKKALVQLLTNIEAERFVDKQRLKAVLSKKSVKMPVLDELTQLKDKLEKKISPDLFKEIEPYIFRIENIYLETRDMLLSAASSGLSAGVAIHEAEKRVNLLKSNLMDVGSIDIQQIKRIVMELDGLLTDLSLIYKKSGKAEESIYDMSKAALRNLDLRFLHHGISILDGLNIKQDITAVCSRRLVVASIMNIIDNAIWWLGQRGEKRKYIYLGSGYDYYKKPSIVIGDSGPGFQDAPSDLVRPFFTRKAEGMGLGLYLANEIMLNDGGELVFPDSGDLELPAEITGAVVALIFKGGIK